MALQPDSTGGNFQQVNNLFAAEGPVTTFVQNVYEFSDNLSDTINDIISFLNVAAVFLKALKSPIEILLIPLLNSFQSYLEDLKNIGAGVLTVWPWECGTNPTPINFDQLLSGLKKFESYYFSDNNSLSTSLDASPSILANSLNSIKSNLVDSETDISQSTIKNKENVLEAYNSVKNFLDPDSSYWEDSTIGDALKVIRTFLNKRELTPEQVIDIINSSFDDINDSQRPKGKGDYVAFVLLAALPSFSGINQVITQFGNFFGGVFDTVTPEGKLIAEKEANIVRINLGNPVIPRNTKTKTDKYFFNDTILRDGIPDGVYKPGNNVIPMFKPGDLIVQTQESIFSSSFSAIVDEHLPIKIKNGKVIQNVVRVRDASGELLKSHSTKKNSNPGTIRLNTNGLDPLKSPMFLPATNSYTDFEVGPYSTIIATMEEGSTELKDVFPNVKEIKKLKILAKAGQNIYQLDPSEYSNEVVSTMVKFVSTLSVGKMISHPFLKSLDGAYSDDGGISTSAALKFLPSIGLNHNISQIFIENTETGQISELKGAKIDRQLFRFSEEDDEKKNTNEKIIGMNRIILKIGRLLSDGSIDDSSSFLGTAVSPPGKVNFFDFAETLSDGRANPAIQLLGVNSTTPPNWKFFTINEFLPIYGDMIDYIVGIIKTAKSWLKTSDDMLEEAIRFLTDFADWLDEINQKILTALQFLTQGLNAAGIYTLSLSGSGGPSNFKKKLKDAKFVQTRANPFPSMELQTVKKTSTIINPITGIPDTVTTNTLKPVLVPPDAPSSSPKILSVSDLNGLKYSLAVVFYAQGDDSKGLSRFLDNFSMTQTFLNSLVGNLTGSETLAEKITPYVYDIQLIDGEQDPQGAENATVSSNFKMRVIFTNDAHELTDEEQSALTAIQGRNVDLTPRVNTTSLHLSEEDNRTGKAEFTLKKGDDFVLLKNPPSVSYTEGSGGRQFFNIDFEPLEQIPPTGPGEPSYSFSSVNADLYSAERMKIKPSSGKKLNSGFKVLQTTVLDVEIN